MPFSDTSVSSATPLPRTTRTLFTAALGFFKPAARATWVASLYSEREGFFALLDGRFPIEAYHLMLDPRLHYLATNPKAFTIASWITPTGSF